MKSIAFKSRKKKAILVPEPHAPISTSLFHLQEQSATEQAKVQLHKFSERSIEIIDSMGTNWNQEPDQWLILDQCPPNKQEQKQQKDNASQHCKTMVSYYNPQKKGKAGSFQRLGHCLGFNTKTAFSRFHSQAQESEKKESRCFVSTFQKKALLSKINFRSHAKSQSVAISNLHLPQSLPKRRKHNNTEILRNNQFKKSFTCEMSEKRNSVKPTENRKLSKGLGWLVMHSDQKQVDNLNDKQEDNSSKACSSSLRQELEKLAQIIKKESYNYQDLAQGLPMRICKY